jgi:tetratricopeptide (TPR) repeat protein
VIEFASLYDDQAGNNPGVPILLTPERKGNLTRASVKETYERIQHDLEDALPLLPDNIEPIKKNRPSKPAVYALLARIYLSRGSYTQAKQYADACLQRYTTLIDYNNISLTAPIPFSISNEEVLYQTNLLSSISTFFLNNFFVDSTLYRSYGSTDLRKELYFYLNASGLPLSRSSYTGSPLRFSGLATDEVYLIRAECQARASNINAAMDDLNHLLSKRYRSTHFTPLSTGSAKEALDLVLKERRKELIYRGLRWTDIRRLNKENYNISLKRTIKGKEYILPAGDNRFVLPIPPDVISSNKDMPQNPR